MLLLFYIRTLKYRLSLPWCLKNLLKHFFSSCIFWSNHFLQDSSKQNAYRKFLKNDTNYEKFLNATFAGLKPSHNLLNLIITTASRNPDSTIEVRAGQELNYLVFILSNPKQVTCTDYAYFKHIPVIAMLSLKPSLISSHLFL